MLNYISCCEDQCWSLIYDGCGVGEETVLKTVRPETELRGNDSRGRGGIKEF